MQTITVTKRIRIHTRTYLQQSLNLNAESTIVISRVSKTYLCLAVEATESAMLFRLYFPVSNKSSLSLSLHYKVVISFLERECFFRRFRGKESLFFGLDFWAYKWGNLRKWSGISVGAAYVTSVCSTGILPHSPHTGVRFPFDLIG